MKSLSIANVHHSNSDFKKCFKAFTASHFIELNKIPRLQPVGVGEVLPRIVRKVVMYKAKKDAKDAAGVL